MSNLPLETDKCSHVPVWAQIVFGLWGETKTGQAELPHVQGDYPNSHKDPFLVIHVYQTGNPQTQSLGAMNFSPAVLANLVTLNMFHLRKRKATRQRNFYCSVSQMRLSL